MPKTKKNIISNKLNKLSLKIEAIHKELDGPNQSIKKLKQELAQITQGLDALRKNIQSEISDIEKRSDDNPVQASGPVNLMSYNASLPEEGDAMKKDKEASTLEQLTEILTQCEMLSAESEKLKRNVKTIEDAKKFSQEEVKEQLLAKFLREGAFQEKLQQRSELQSNQDSRLTDELNKRLIDKLNKEYCECKKTIIYSKDFYKKLSDNVKNRIQNAPDTASLDSILILRLQPVLLLNVALEVEEKMQGKVEGVDKILRKSGQEAIIHKNGMFHLENIKQVEGIRNSIVQPKVSPAACTMQPEK